MSGTQAYFSFLNAVKATLASTLPSVTVLNDQRVPDSIDPPYLLFQQLTDRLQTDGKSEQMCQAWVVVPETNTEPLVVTMDTVMTQVLLATRTTALWDKYDYSVTPKRNVGAFRPRVMEVTKDMSQDAGVAAKVVTWVLASVG